MSRLTDTEACLDNIKRKGAAGCMCDSRMPASLKQYNTDSFFIFILFFF